MNTFSAKDIAQTIEEFDLTIIDLNDYNYEDLIRQKELGDKHSFKYLEKQFIRLIDKINLLERTYIPILKIKHLTKSLSNLKKIYVRIVNYDLTNQQSIDPEIEKKSITKEIHKSISEITSHLSEFLPVYNTLTEKTESINIEGLINEKLKSKEDELNKLLKDSEYSKVKITTILENVEKASKEVGVTKFGEVFLIESNKNKKSSVLWLVFTIITIVSLLLFSIYFFNELDNIDYNITGQVIQFSLYKITIIGALLYFLSICRSNYKAHRHNQILNKHRHNALLTFQTFTDATEDIQTKNAVLLEATHTIFSNQRTGYLKDEKDNDGTNRVIELIKDVKGS